MINGLTDCWRANDSISLEVKWLKAVISNTKFKTEKAKMEAQEKVEIYKEKL